MIEHRDLKLVGSDVVMTVLRRRPEDECDHIGSLSPSSGHELFCLECGRFLSEQESQRLYEMYRSS